MQYVYRLDTVLTAAQVVLGCVAITAVRNDCLFCTAPHMFYMHAHICACMYKYAWLHEVSDVSNDLMLVELASLVLLVTVSAMGSVILVKGSLNRI